MDRVAVPNNGRIVDLPPRCGKHVFVAFIPRPLHDLARMAFVLLDGGIGDKPDVVVHVEVEQGTRLAAGLGHDQVVECKVLGAQMRNDRDREMMLKSSVAQKECCTRKESRERKSR